MKRTLTALILFSLVSGAAFAQEAVSVPVLLKPVKSGETITTENLTTHEIDRRNTFASTITNAGDLTGTVATRALAAGQPINRLHVRAARAVMRDSSVRVVFNRPGISLAGSGKALEDGNVGEVVRIMNLATRTTLSGEVVADGVVEVR